MGETILSGMMMIFSYAMVIVLLWKVFQISTDLGEVKTLLKEMRQASARAEPAAKPVAAVVPIAAAPVLAGPISLESAEALLREVAAESHSISEHPKTTA